jgi:hypothetical protein
MWVHKGLLLSVALVGMCYMREVACAEDRGPPAGPPAAGNTGPPPPPIVTYEIEKEACPKGPNDMACGGNGAGECVYV